MRRLREAKSLPEYAINTLFLSRQDPGLPPTELEKAMAKTLAERLRAHEQMKARLASAEALLRLDERKQRTRRLIEAGSMVEKIGLLNLDGNALYGALLSLRDGAGNPERVEKWAAVGRHILGQEARTRDASKEPVLLTFTAPLSKEATLVLRKAGFRYSRVMQHWEGLARFEEASIVARAHGGVARSVSRTGSPPEATARPEASA